MKKPIFLITLLTLVGLVVVYGEIEAIKVGYDIRKLMLRSRDLQFQLKESEMRLASLTAPQRLETKMMDYQVQLANPKLIRVARLSTETQMLRDMPDEPQKMTLLARLFLSSAQANPSPE